MSGIGSVSGSDWDYTPPSVDDTSDSAGAASIESPEQAQDTPSPSMAADQTDTPSVGRNSQLDLPEDSAKAEDDASGAKRAQAAAADLWFTSKDDGSKFTKVEATATQANESTPERDAKLTAQIESNRTQESTDLAKLDATQQQNYRDVSDQLQGAPAGQLAMQNLLNQGKLTEGPKAADGTTLLDNLHTMATEPLAAGVNRKELISDTAQEINNPTSINQGDRGTCTVSSLQVMTAKQNPAEYARIEAGLASESKQVTLADGKTTIQANESALRKDPLVDVDDQGRILKNPDGSTKTIEDTRDITTRLWAPAMMELGNGAATYDNVKDQHSNTQDGGLEAPELKTAVDAVTGKPSDYIYSKEAKTKAQSEAMKDQIMTRLKDSVGQGQPVLAGLDWRDNISHKATSADESGHEILVTKIDNGRVYYNNTNNSSSESMSVKEFRRRIEDANFPQRP